MTELLNQLEPLVYALIQKNQQLQQKNRELQAALQEVELHTPINNELADLQERYQALEQNLEHQTNQINILEQEKQNLIKDLSQERANTQQLRQQLDNQAKQSQQAENNSEIEQLRIQLAQETERFRIQYSLLQNQHNQTIANFNQIVGAQVQHFKNQLNQEKQALIDEINQLKETQK